MDFDREIELISSGFEGLVMLVNIVLAIYTLVNRRYDIFRNGASNATQAQRSSLSIPMILFWPFLPIKYQQWKYLGLFVLILIVTFSGGVYSGYVNVTNTEEAVGIFKFVMICMFIAWFGGLIYTQQNRQTDQEKYWDQRGYVTMAKNIYSWTANNAADRARERGLI